VRKSSEWKIYRTRFLIKAKQLVKPLAFVDVLGREHRGEAGDYLVESSDGTRRIAPREIFEDVYVAMGPTDPADSSPVRCCSPPRPVDRIPSNGGLPLRAWPTETILWKKTPANPHPGR